MYEQLESLLVQHFNIPPDRLQPQMTLSEAELDSLALLELSVVLEEHYGANLLDQPEQPGPETTLAEIATWLDTLRSADAVAESTGRPTPSDVTA
ncbi:acyl carrier protein [Streptomyces sp. NPDC012769]|uniref:acyl carrier protein n=1 Tax=Streptomyces sp. NPDC012769 TaxID=3364848 RepID=UPI003675CE6B